MVNGLWVFPHAAPLCPAESCEGVKLTGLFTFLHDNDRVDDFLLTFYKRLLLDDKNWKRAKWRHVLPEPEL